MSQYKDIPQPTDQRNVSQNDILTNYQYLATSQGGPPAGIPNGIIKVDHEQFGNNVTNPKDGFHNQVSFINRGIPANLVNSVSGASSDSIVYASADGAGLSQIRFINSSIDSPITYLRAMVLFDGTGAILGQTQNVNNPGGVTKNGTGDFTVNFSVALPTVNYLVFIQGFAPNSPVITSYTNKTVNSVKINLFTTGGGRVSPNETSVIIFGLF
jgi:hypothetical protein